MNDTKKNYYVSVLAEKPYANPIFCFFLCSFKRMFLSVGVSIEKSLKSNKNVRKQHRNQGRAPQKCLRLCQN